MTTSAEFQALFLRGQRIDRLPFVVLWADTPGERRVGFAVSRQLKRAVDRNRIRRRLREAYRRVRGAAPARVAVVVVGKKRVLDMGFDALVTDLRATFAVMSRK